MTTSTLDARLDTQQLARAAALGHARAILGRDAAPDVTDLHSLAVFILDGTDPRERFATRNAIPGVAALTFDSVVELGPHPVASPTDSPDYRAAVDDERFRAGLREGLRLAETYFDHTLPPWSKSVRESIFGKLAALYRDVEAGTVTTTADLDK